MSRNAYTPCDEKGCTLTPMDGPMFRVNPKGEIGVFMCRAHAEAVEREAVFDL